MWGVLKDGTNQNHLFSVGEIISTTFLGVENLVILNFKSIDRSKVIEQRSLAYGMIKNKRKR